MKSLITYLCILPIFSIQANYLGTYVLKVQIGERTFTDILTLNKIEQHGTVSGRFAVPQVFDVPFKGSLKDQKLDGHFFAEEGGTTFEVELEAQFISPCKIKGKLFQGGIQFADFVGSKEVCDESSH